MNDDRRFERALQSWLSRDDDRVPSDLVYAVGLAARSTHQERRLPQPWNATTARPGGARALAVAGVVLAALGLALAALVGRPEEVPSTPTTSIAPLGFQGTGTIAFTRMDAATGTPGAYVVDPSGADEARLVPDFGCCGIFAPDGRSIAVGFEETVAYRGPGPLAAAMVVSLDGRRLFGLPGTCGGCYSLQGIEWLPRAWSVTGDGTAIALQVRGISTPAGDGIHVADSGPPGWYWGQQYVTGKGMRDVPIAFSPDGAELMFLRSVDQPGDQSRGEVFVVRLADGLMRQISPVGVETVTGGTIVGAGWSRDGTQIAFVGYEPNATVGRLYVVDADGQDPARIADDVESLAWSPDGAWIAASTAGAAGDIHLVRPDGSGLRNLTAAFDAGAIGPRWSPDGLSLLALGSVPGAGGDGYLIVVPIDGRPIAQVTTVLGAYADWSWGPASRSDH